MKKLVLFLTAAFAIVTVFAQPKTEVVKPAATVTATPPPVVSTKELKKQLNRNFKNKKYKAVLPIADTLLSRNPKDEDIFNKKLVCEVMLKMDSKAIADIKKFYKNKDTAGSILASIPYQLDFASTKRSGNVYYKAGMAWAPKNGMTYLMYSFSLADEGKMDEAVKYGKKGYDLLDAKRKLKHASVYGSLMFYADKKEEAYKFLEEQIAAGNTNSDVIIEYFGFYKKDEKFQEGIDKATELIKADSLGNYFARRAVLYDAMGNHEMACEDAMTLRERFNESDYWLKRFNCPAIMADIQPTPQRTYIYELVFQGREYDFRVSNAKVDMANGVSFKFKMTGDNAFSGKVNIAKDAISSAHAQMNMFSQEDIELTEQTTVWISSEVFNELKTNGSSNITADPFYGEQNFVVVHDDEDEDDGFYTVSVDDENKYIKYIKIASSDGKQELWINDDATNPVILKMNLSFTIRLKQVI